MRPMRVLYLTHYAELYGANRSLLDLVVSARDTGAVEPFVVLAAPGDLCASLEQHRIDHAVVPFPSWMHKRVLMGGPHHRLMQRWRYHRAAGARDREAGIALQALRSLARVRGIELVHANSSVIGSGGPLARALRVPFIWHIRELPFLHYGFQVDGGRRRYVRELRSADRIIAISRAVATEVERLAGRGDRVITLPDGVIGACQLQALAKAGSWHRGQGDPFTFLSIGLIHPSKGQEMAVEAFGEVHKAFPDTALLIAGGGRDAALKEFIQDKGLADAVHLPGFVRDTGPLFDRGHALLQCSRHEALGRVTLEAMAHGMPVIGLRSGATPELVEHGVDGLLFNTREELVQGMVELLRSEGLCRQLGEAGRRKVAATYTVESMVHRTCDVYRSLIPGT